MNGKSVSRHSTATAKHIRLVVIRQRCRIAHQHVNDTLLRSFSVSLSGGNCRPPSIAQTQTTFVCSRLSSATHRWTSQQFPIAGWGGLFVGRFGLRLRSWCPFDCGAQPSGSVSPFALAIRLDCRRLSMGNSMRFYCRWPDCRRNGAAEACRRLCSATFHCCRSFLLTISNAKLDSPSGSPFPVRFSNRRPHCGMSTVSGRNCSLIFERVFRRFLSVAGGDRGLACFCDGRYWTSSGEERDVLESVFGPGRTSGRVFAPAAEVYGAYTSLACRPASLEGSGSSCGSPWIYRGRMAPQSDEQSDRMGFAAQRAAVFAQVPSTAAACN